MEILNSSPKEPSGKVHKTEAQWREELAPDQFHILREAGTEAPGGKTYQDFSAQGDGAYHCAGCGALLFTSTQKFDSGCGWPSFFDPAKAENVNTKADHSGGYTRVEVTCAICDGHLGHVFEGEGYNTPTDLRYCINGAGLKFLPANA